MRKNILTGNHMRNQNVADFSVIFGNDVIRCACEMNWALWI